MLNFDWLQIGSALTALSVIGVFLAWCGRTALRPYFVERRAHQALEDRVTAVETLARKAATQEDVRAVERRLAEVERSSSANGATLAAVQDSVRRSERMLEMLVQHMLNKEKSA